MEYRTFGRTGCKVSVFTLGTMRFIHGWEEPHDELPDDSLENAHMAIKTALDAGINHIETARGYGKSERLIGATLPHLAQRRSDYLIMSKAPPSATEGEMRGWIEDSLQRLGVDHLDLFAVHGINNPALADLTFRKNGCLPALEKAKAEGLIGAIGFSTHAPLPVLLNLISSDAFDFVNLHYYTFRTGNRAAVDLAHAKNMGVFIISPNEKGGRLYEPPPKLQQLTAPLHPAQFNERWLLAHHQIHTLSIGINQPDHLAIHQGSLGNPPYWGLTERQIAARIAQAGAESPMERCSWCINCLPCPEQIDIPEVMRMLHMTRSFDMTLYGQFRYGLMKPEDHWIPGAKGNACTRCGDCLPRCPQGLAIPDLLMEAHQRMNTDSA